MDLMALAGELILLERSERMKIGSMGPSW